VAGDNYCGVRKREELLVDRADKGGAVAAGKVGAADGAGE
jgi:hypothetical protein